MDKLKLLDKVTAILKNKDGKIKQQECLDDLVTTVGWNYMCDSMGKPPTTVTGESVGTGDGSTKTFSLDNKFIVNVVGKVNGTAQGLESTDSRAGTMTFKTAPANGTTIIADYKYFAQGWIFDYIAIGTGTAEAEESDTALGNEITTGGGARVQETYVHTADTKIWKIEHEFTFTASFSVSEAGLFNASSGGSMLCRRLFTTVFDAESGDKLEIRFEFTLA